MADIADLGFRVDTSSLRAAIRQLNGVGDSSKLASASLKGLVGASAAAAGAALALVTVVAQQTKQTDTMAQTLGIATGTLQEFHAAARTVGIEADKMGDIFKDLEDKIGEAFQEGTGEGAAALELLGLKAQDLINLPVDKKLEAIGQALSGVDTRSGQISIMEMLADDAALLLPLLDGNNEKLQEARARAIETGQALDDFDSTALVMVGQAMSDLAANTQGSANIFSAELAPAVLVAQRYITDMLDAFSKEDVEAFASFAVDAIGVLLDVVQSLEKVLRLSGVGWTTIAAAATSAMAESADAVASVINTVLRPFQLILAKIAEGWATITGALAKVTTGNVSKGFSAAAESLRDFSAEAEAFSVSADDIRAGNVKVNESLKSQIKALNELSNSPAYSDAFKARIAAVKVEIEAKSKAEAENRKGQQGLAAQLRLTSAEIEAQRKATEKAEAEWDRWLEGVKDSIDPMRELQREAEKVIKALDLGKLSPEQAQQHMKKLTDDFKELEKININPFESMGKGMDEMASGINSVAGAMQGMYSEGERGYQNMAVAMQAANAVAAAGAVLRQGTGDPYTAFARMAAMAAAVAGLGYSVGGIGGGFEDTAAIRQAEQGTGTVLGDSSAKSESIAKSIDVTASATSELVGINRGMLSALQSMQSGINGASVRIAQGAKNVDFGATYKPTNVFDSISSVGQQLAEMPVLGGAFNVVDKLLGKIPVLGEAFKEVDKLLGWAGDLSSGLLGGAFKSVGKLLGGKSKVTDEGVQIIGGAMAEMIEDTTVKAYQTVKSKKHVGASSKTSTSFVEMDDDVGRQFSAVFESLADSVYAGAKALGFAGDDVSEQINNFVIETQKISLKGLDAEKQSAEIEAVFSSIFDNLSGSVVDFLPDFQQAGEGLGETLARVATQVQVAEEAAFRLGFAAEQIDPEQFTHLADGLIKASGGIEEFISGMSSFVDSFAPEAHKFEIASTGLEKALTAVGLSVPETAEGMWELMQSLDATTEEGQEQIATLLRLTDTADGYYKMLESGTGSAFAAIQKLSEALQDFVRNTQNSAQSLKTQLMQLQGDTEGTRNAERARIRDALNAQVNPTKAQLSALKEQQAAAAAAGASKTAIEQQLAEAKEHAKAFAVNAQYARNVYSLGGKTVEVLGVRYTADQFAESVDYWNQKVADAEEALNTLGADSSTGADSGDLAAQIEKLQNEIKAAENASAAQLAAQEAIWKEEDRQAAAARAKQRADERLGLEMQELRSIGDIAAIRELELKAIHESNRDVQLRIWALEDEAKEIERLNAVYDQRIGIEQRITELTENTVDAQKWLEEARKVELKGIDETLHERQRYLWSLEDEAKAAAEAAAINSKRFDLEGQMLRLLGEEQEAVNRERDREIQALQELSPELIDVQRGIWALQDSAQLISDLQSGMSDALAGLRKSIDLEISGINDSYAAQIDAIKATTEAEDELARQRIDDAQQSIQSLKSLRSMLSGGIRALQDPDGATGRFSAAQDQIAQALAKARQGNLPTAEALESAMAGVGEYDRQMFDSAEDAAFQAAVTANQLKELDSIAGRQLSIEESTLEHMQESDDSARIDRESQIALLEQQRDNDIAAAQRQYEQMEAQVNALLGIDTSVKSVADATLKVEEAIKALAAAETARQQLIEAQGQQGEAAGGSAEGGGLQPGQSTPRSFEERVSEGFNPIVGGVMGRLPPATQAVLDRAWSASGRIPGFASGGYTGNVATDEIAGLVHGQEFVLNAAATRSIGVSTLQAMNQGHSPSAIYGDGGSMVGRMVAAAVEGLRSEMRSALGSIAANTYQSATILDNATRGGALATVAEQ